MTLAVCGMLNTNPHIPWLNRKHCRPWSELLPVGLDIKQKRNQFTDQLTGHFQSFFFLFFFIFFIFRAFFLISPEKTVKLVR